MGIDRLLLPASAGVAMRVVGHSMGGLITMRELISHPESRRKVPLLVFYATQQEGAQIARIANEIVSNRVMRQLFPADGNAYLRQLNEDWVRARETVARPTMVCAYERSPRTWKMSPKRSGRDRPVRPAQEPQWRPPASAARRATTKK